MAVGLLTTTCAVALASVVQVVPVAAAGQRASIPTVIHIDSVAPISAGRHVASRCAASCGVLPNSVR